MPEYKVVFTHPKVGMGDLSEYTFEAKASDMATVPYDTASKAVAKEYKVDFNEVSIHKIVGA